MRSTELPDVISYEDYLGYYGDEDDLPLENKDYFIVRGVSDWPMELAETEITWNLPSFHNSTTPFGNCEAACGIGYQYRKKFIEMPDSSCVGIECEISMIIREKRTCYAGKCPGKNNVLLRSQNGNILRTSRKNLKKVSLVLPPKSGLFSKRLFFKSNPYDKG